MYFCCCSAAARAQILQVSIVYSTWKITLPPIAGPKTARPSLRHS